MTESLESFRERQERLAQDLDGARTIVHELGYPGLEPPFVHQARSAREFRFRIAVIGEFSAGKSTLLNAFLGEPLLPAKMPPCTAAPIEISYGRERSLRVRRRGKGAPEERPFSELPQLVSLKADRIEDIARERATADIELIEVLAPLAVCENRVTLLDTPGLNEAQARTEITLGLLPTVDAAIVLTTANHLLSKTERDFLQVEAQKDPADRRWMDCAFVCASFADVASEDDSLDELRQRLDDFCDGLLGGPPFAPGRRYFIDSKSVLHRATGKPVKSQGIDYDRFLSELERFVVHERGAAGYRSQLVAAHRLLAQARAQVASEKRSLDDDAAQVAARAEVAQATLRRERERVGRMVASMQRMSERFARDLATDFRSSAAVWLDKDIIEYGGEIEYPDSVILRVDPVAEWYGERFSEWLEARSQHWAQTVPGARLEELLGEFESAHSEDLAELKASLISVRTSLGLSAGEDEASLGEGLEWLLKSAAAYAVGGPLAILVGSTLGWSGLLANLGINFAIGFVAGMIGLAIPVVGWIAIGAAVAAAQLFLGQSGIKARIRDKVLEELRPKARAQLEEAASTVHRLARDGVLQVADGLNQAASGLIAELENAARTAERAAQSTESQRSDRTRILEAADKRLEAIQGHMEAL